MKLDFPRFKGGDPTSWVFKVIQYFNYYQDKKLRRYYMLLTILDDDALV